MADCNDDTFVVPLELTFCSRKISTSAWNPNCTLSCEVGLKYEDGFESEPLFFTDTAKLYELLHFAISHGVLYTQQKGHVVAIETTR